MLLERLPHALATDYGGGGAVPTQGDYCIVQQGLCTCNGCPPIHGNRHNNTPEAVTATILGRVGNDSTWN